jgi:hypothetical protein
MASVYRKKRYTTVPANAEIVASPASGGKTRRMAHWIDAGGKQRKADVHSHPRLGDRLVVGEMKKWYIAYQSENGRKHVVGYTDKAASIALGDRIWPEVARIPSLWKRFISAAQLPPHGDLSSNRVCGEVF